MTTGEEIRRQKADSLLEFEEAKSELRELKEHAANSAKTLKLAARDLASYPARFLHDRRAQEDPDDVSEVTRFLPTSPVTLREALDYTTVVDLATRIEAAERRFEAAQKNCREFGLI
jgi:hypothetical protein